MTILSFRPKWSFFSLSFFLITDNNRLVDDQVEFDFVTSELSEINKVRMFTRKIFPSLIMMQVTCKRRVKLELE